MDVESRSVKASGEEESGAPATGTLGSADQAALSCRLTPPAWELLMTSTDRSIADHSSAISILQAGSPCNSPALAPGLTTPGW